MNDQPLPACRTALLPSLLVLMLATVSACTGEAPGVTVMTGPTEIPGGDALGTGDITVGNERFAVAFAVDTAPPWGVARGGIIDVATVSNGEYSPDRASLVDFMPNDWSDWPSSYQDVTVEKQTADEAVVRTERDWGEVSLVTTYTIRAGDNRLHLLTEMTNEGDEALSDLSSGYVLWPDGGFIFGIPGLAGLEEGSTAAALASWSAFYDEDWMLGLHATFDDHINNDARDRYFGHDLAVGESRRFEAWLQVGDRGELATLVENAIQLQDLDAGQISGTLSAVDGSPVVAAVVAERVTGTGNHPYAWAFGENGRYSFQLPPGSYRLYATAKGYAKSNVTDVEISGDQSVTRDFNDLQPPGNLKIRVVAEETGTPLDARITIEEGDAPLIGYFGKATYFTELATAGEASLVIAPGRYRFRVSSGEGFTAAPVFLEIEVPSGESREVTAVVDVAADPASRGWYGADLHHHSDVLDGYTPPHFVLSSELAAGLDIAFLSDHDSVINNDEMGRLAAERSVPFIPATEFSPSWAHFNAYPLDPGETISIDVGNSTVQQIFAEARRMGADVVQANHPFNAYGYFSARQNEVIPGGFSHEFDLVEFSATEPNDQTILEVWDLWNEGRRVYLSAGSDAHDVWQEISGAVRTYAYVDGELTVDKFIDAVKRGHSYATAGPLVFPETMFGEEIRYAANESLELAFELQSVLGLASVTLIERGNRVETRAFDGPAELTPVVFTVRPDGDSWYSLVVEDTASNAAYTNPVWVRASD